MKSSKSSRLTLSSCRDGGGHANDAEEGSESGEELHDQLEMLERDAE